MVGLRRALEIFQVAAGASRVRTGQGVVAVHVALGALNGCMCAGQRKAGVLPRLLQLSPLFLAPLFVGVINTHIQMT